MARTPQREQRYQNATVLSYEREDYRNCESQNMRKGAKLILNEQKNPILKTHKRVNFIIVYRNGS